ncbi:MAG: citrate synthase [Elusimicrobiota bacterium]
MTTKTNASTSSAKAEKAETAIIKLGGKEYEYPIIVGSEGERGIDIRKLRGETGHITYDPGYVNTGACDSAITFIDGEKGILNYRGIPIDEICAKSDFIEASYLCIYGRLPNQQELDKFRDEIKHETMIHEDMKRFYDGFPRDAHPMAILSSAVNTVSTFHDSALHPAADVGYDNIDIIRLIAKLPTIAAYAYKKSTGLPGIYPRVKYSYAANFLWMMFGTRIEDYEPDPIAEKAIDQLLMLHIDHEQNCSTSTVRLVGSSRANLYASISAGIAALWGPLHGGANQAVLEMLEVIRKDGCNYQKYVDMVKDKQSGFKLMGFGHRVYKNFDPRARIIKKSADVLLKKLGVDDPLLEIAMRLEEIALKDPYFAERKLYPNVDFYSGIIYKALGIPTNMFTVMFAIGRLPGWIAQWKEMVDDFQRIGRPRQIYTGNTLTKYTPMDKRK